jgi:perosamine synthetase
LQEKRKSDTSSPWLYTFKFLELENDISKVREALISKGIDTRPVFIPMSKLPPYKDSARGTFNISENISDLGLSVPTFNAMTSDQIAFICAEINRIV